MKKLISALLLLAFVFLPYPSKTAHALSDIGGHMYQEAILYLESSNIIDGYPDGTYKPYNSINRAEFTKIIVGAKLGTEPTSYTPNCFPDVPAGIWFEKWVCYAKGNNIVNGYDSGYFLPGGNINVSEAAKIAANVFSVPLAEVGSNAPWYEPYLGGLQAKGFLPSSFQTAYQLVSRGEMAEMIYRIMQNITTKPTTSFSVTPSPTPALPVEPLPVEPDGGIGNNPVVPPVSGGNEEMILDGFFPLGPFSQPAETFNQWIGRGANSIYEYPMGTNVVAWDIAADNAGLFRFRRPSGDAARDALDDWMLANIDEPDITANDSYCGGYEGACTDAAIDLATDWESDFPDKLQWMNLAGPNVWLSSQYDYCNGPGDEGGNTDCYPSLIDTGADFVGMDVYPVGGWLPYEIDRNRVTLVGDVLDKIRGWLSSDQETFAIIETSDQKLGWQGTGARGPTAAEVRAMMWNAINHGARGIFFFSAAFNPFVFDATPADVAAEITTQSALITALAPVLQTAINPSSISVTGNANLDIGWRVSGGNAYIIALNTQNSQLNNASITVTGSSDSSAEVYGESRTVNVNSGSFTDNFGAYGVHIYVMSL